MPLSIGVNLRVTGHCNQGGRKYMEDMFSVAFQSTPDDKDLEYAFFGIFDGHGGGEAATFAKEHLMNVIVKQKNFWSDRDEDVLRAIRDGYVNTHYAMWRELDKWPRTASGLPSTAGTTASIAFIRKGKIYIGHVGDSGIILGYQVDGDPQWRAKALTKDHKPESGPEMVRIRESGGKVVSKSGVPRVVWNRPRIGHKGPVRRSTHIDEIPFLAVARSLGDLWSYNSELDTFVVSPEPDVKVVAIDVESHRCLIFGTDGLWNMLTPQAAVAIVQAADRHNEKHLIASQQTCNGQADNVQLWINPSKSLVDRALERWSSKRLRADNTSVVTLMLDPPGPSRSEVILSQKECGLPHHTAPTLTATPVSENPEKLTPSPVRSVPRPSPIITHNVDLKRPDFLPGTEDSREPRSDNPLLVNKVDENFDLTHESKDLMHANVENNPIESSIRVAETISNGIVDNLEPSIAEFEKDYSTEVIERPDSEQSEKVDKQEDAIDEATRENESSESKDRDDSNVKNVIHQSAFPSERNDIDSSTCVSSNEQNSEFITESNANENEIKSDVLNKPRHKQSTLFSAPRTEIRNGRRGHTLNAHSRNTIVDSGSLEGKTYVNSRFKLRSTKVSVTGNTVEESVRNSASKTRSSAVGNKRRHSAISQSVVNTSDESCVLQESSVKRRTRSEDRRNPVDENDPANQSTKDASSNLSWPTTESNITRSTTGATTVPVQDRLSLNTFQRNLGKKATPVKAIRRPSLKGLLKQLWAASRGAREWDQGKSNRSTSSCTERRINRTMSIIGSPDTVSQRWLRSDTIAAATPVKTLRSRNVEINGHTISAQLVHQYGMVKQSRLSLPSKLKQSGNNGFLQSSRVRSSSLSSGIKQNNNGTGNGACSTINPTSTGCNSSSGMAKRVKSPYNPSARSLSTRSRIKRLGK